MAIAGMFLVTILLLSISAGAGANWWDKGQELLKTIGANKTQTGLSVEEIGAGLKDALRVGSENVITQLGRTDGFNMDPAIHIPLPKRLDTVKLALDKIGMSGMLQELELRLNRAAEVATPKAKKLFGQAITEMTFDDVKKIYDGPKDAATLYFRKKMSPALMEEMRPVVTDSLAEVGAIQSYDNVMKEYRSLPFVPEVKANLTDYVVKEGINGIFYYMAKEEAAIRQNPVKRTTNLLKQVFGAK